MSYRKLIAGSIAALAFITCATAADFTKSKTYANNFADVPDSEWYASSVKDAYDEYSKYKDYIDNAQTAADIFVNGLDKRTAVSIAYDAGTTGFGFIPVVGDFVPFGCLDWWCQAHSCKDNGVAADNCGEYLYDKYQNKKEQKDSLRSAGATVDFYKVADPYLLAWHDLLEFTTFEIDRSRLIAECVGADDELMKKVGLNDYLNVVIDSISQTKKIDVEKVKTIPVSDQIGRAHV